MPSSVGMVCYAAIGTGIDGSICPVYLIELWRSNEISMYGHTVHISKWSTNKIQYAYVRQLCLAFTNIPTLAGSEVPLWDHKTSRDPIWKPLFSSNPFILRMRIHRPRVTCPKAYGWLCAGSNLSCCLQEENYLRWDHFCLRARKLQAGTSKITVRCASFQVSNRHFELLPKHAKDKLVSFPSFPPLHPSHSVLVA